MSMAPVITRGHVEACGGARLVSKGRAALGGHANLDNFHGLRGLW